MGSSALSAAPGTSTGFAFHADGAAGVIASRLQPLASPQSADTIWARRPDGRNQAYERIRCETRARRSGFQRLPPGQAGFARAGDNSISIPAGRLGRGAAITIVEVPDGEGRRVLVTVDPPEAVVGDVLLTLSYQGCALRESPAALRIVNLSSGIELPDPVHDAARRTVSVPVDRFSEFVLAELL